MERIEGSRISISKKANEAYVYNFRREETQEELENRLWEEDGLVDKLCKDMYGHTNWEFQDTEGLSFTSQEEGGTLILFYKGPHEIPPEEVLEEIMGVDKNE